MTDRYILDSRGKPVPMDDLGVWGQWMQEANRCVAFDTTPKGMKVSTVFLGLDHRFISRGAPILWETRIFGGAEDGYQRRYTKRADAVRGHATALKLALAAERKK
jgi:hypothetical protein